MLNVIPISLCTKKRIGSRYENAIKRIVCDHFRTSMHELIEMQDNNRREFVEPRQIIMVLLKEYTTLSNQLAGAVFGKDHATVTHAIKVVSNRADTEPPFRGMMLSLRVAIELQFDRIDRELRDSKEKRHMEVLAEVPMFCD